MARSAIRRRALWLLAGGVAAVGACTGRVEAGPVASPTPTVTPTASPTPTVNWPQLALAQLVTGLSAPSHIANAGDGSGRLFIVQQGGIIRLFKNGDLQPTSFLDIHTKVSCCGERGLLSVAFPPDYANKNHFYVYYTNPGGNLVIARYGLTADPDVADPNSENIILTIAHPTFSNHNGGQLAFGPSDGYLYIGIGDGGSGGDPNNNGQNTNVLLGKLLRIDVESGAIPYAIPASNPTITPTPSRPEIWAFGLRNPWRFSFDRQTSDLYIADVGQDSYEEIDYQPAASVGGQNYGWHIMEGFHCYNATSCDPTGLTLPVLEYDHSAGNCSVTGGFVYRGLQFPRMQGLYFYADYCTGRISATRHSGAGWPNMQLYDAPFSITTFGEDEGGELFVADYSGGTIYALIDAAVPTWTPTVTGTPTITRTPSRTETSASTATATRTPTQTATTTGTSTVTATLTRTTSATVTPSVTLTPTATPTFVVSGHITYYSSSLPVPGATVQLAGPASTAAASDSNGQFGFTGLDASTWVITPHKIGDVDTGLSALDAVYMLQSSIGLRQLSAAQQLACDVSGNGTVSAFDAVLLLRRQIGLTAGLPAAQLCGSDWLFVPQPAVVPHQQTTAPQLLGGSCTPGSIQWSPLTGTAANQDFVAIALGDCTGNWQPTSGVAAAAHASTSRAEPARLRVGPGRAVGRRLRVPLEVRATAFSGLTAALQYDPKLLAARGVHRVGSGPGALVQSYEPSPGIVTIAMASAAPLPDRTRLFLQFDVLQPGAHASIRVLQAAVESVNR